MRRGLGKVHIVSYMCEQCGAEHSRPADVTADGMCPLCDFPMRIRDLFSDRRIAALPVPRERRTLARPEAA